MPHAIRSFVILVILIVTSCYLFYLSIQTTDVIFITTRFNNSHNLERKSNDSKRTQNSNNLYGWHEIGDTKEEQIRLRNLSTVIASWSANAEDNVPTVPCLSADKQLLVLSVSASRVRYGVSLTFIMVYPTDVKTVLPKNSSSKPISSHRLRLWCIFDDGSMRPAYSYDSWYGNDRASLLDCSLSPFASDELWRNNRTLRVYLASIIDNITDILMLKAFVTVPKHSPLLPSSIQQSFTLCTSPLHNKAQYLVQWIEFHRLIGFQKFAVYNSTDTYGQLSSLINIYTQKYPNLVDIIQWNFSSLALTDVMSTRYFQTEALHDCLIRYGDQSEWLGMIDLDEYIVPLPPYKTIADYLNQNFGRRIVGSINLWSQFFYTKEANNYTAEEKNTSCLVIERFTFRANSRYKKEREKFLYRPRFVQYLSIHHHLVGLSKEQPYDHHITLAHYVSIDSIRYFPYGDGTKVLDTSIRDKYAKRVQDALTMLNVSIT